jgi:AefR-like transcriptional repressor, C-terminal domain
VRRGFRARARRLQAADLPVPEDRDALAHVSDPKVITVFRLAIAEATHAPEVAQTLDAIGRETTRAALRQIMTQAQASGLLDGRPAEFAEQFSGLLWGNLMISLLLGVAERPNSREAATRSRSAVTAFLHLHPVPIDASTSN